MGVIRRVQGEDLLSTRKGVLAYLFAFAALFGVGDEKTVVEEGEKKEATIGERFLPTFWISHIAKASGWTEDSPR